jgi:EF hand
MKAKRQVVRNFEACSVALITAFAFSSAPVARAQTAAPAYGSTAAKPVSASEADASFARADRNKDGKLSKEEADALPVLAQKFDMADADGDKFVSRAEFEKAVRQ